MWCVTKAPINDVSWPNIKGCGSILEVTAREMRRRKIPVRFDSLRFYVYFANVREVDWASLKIHVNHPPSSHISRLYRYRSHRITLISISYSVFPSLYLLFRNEYRGVPDRWSSGVEVTTVEPNHHWPLVILAVSYAREIFINDQIH